MVLLGVILLLGIGGLVLLWRGVFPVNIIGSGLVGFITVYLAKIMRNQLQSRIIIHDEGVTGYTPMGEKISLSWNDISHKGCWEQQGQEHIYLYAQEQDQLLTIPPQYEDYEGLRTSIEAHHPLELVSLGENQTITDYLRKQLGHQES